VSGPVGFAAAVEFLRSIGPHALVAHEREIARQMSERLRRLPKVRVLGDPDANDRVSVFAITMAGRTPIDIVRAMDAEGIAVRAGDLASLPLLRRLGTETAARVSCYLYTTADEVNRCADVLERL
jgi:cysteine desulfurase/selenocysteine lyase